MIQYSNYTGRITGAVWGGFSVPSFTVRYQVIDGGVTFRWFGCEGWHAELCGPGTRGLESRRTVLCWSLEGLEGQEGLMGYHS
jgi:hypothetical protein